jgi:tRNA 2-(methylsulfanyl)-N6-isopentenyladenosine37 hydroxylase
MLELPLKSKTKEGWAALALKDVDALLLDHASCERKAAAQCMSLIAAYPDYQILVEPLVALAREELLHFTQVSRLINKRGIEVRGDEKDPYVTKLVKSMRNQRDKRLLDRLVISAFIEARSCERLFLLADEVEDKELSDFFASLAKEEAGHYKVFMNLAERCFSVDEVAARHGELREIEDEAMKSVSIRCAIH